MGINTIKNSKIIASVILALSSIMCFSVGFAIWSTGDDNNGKTEGEIEGDSIDIDSYFTSIDDITFFSVDKYNNDGELSNKYLDLKLSGNVTFNYQKLLDDYENLNGIKLTYSSSANMFTLVKASFNNSNNESFFAFPDIYSDAVSNNNGVYACSWNKSSELQNLIYITQGIIHFDAFFTINSNSAYSFNLEDYNYSLSMEVY